MYMGIAHQSNAEILQVSGIRFCAVGSHDYSAYDARQGMCLREWTSISTEESSGYRHHSRNDETFIEIEHEDFLIIKDLSQNEFDHYA